MGIIKKLKRRFRAVPTLHCSISMLCSANRLKGKTIVVTGGGSGIGKAIAKKAIAEGGFVIITGRRQEKLSAVADDLGENCKYLVCDVTTLHLDSNWFEQLHSQFDRPITSFVNNAGIYVDKPMGDFVEQDFDSVVSTNLKGPFFLMQEYVQYCIKRNIEGNIVVTVSNRALMGDVGPYGMCKAALVNIVQGFARENIKNHIRINAVAPGMTATEINNLDASDNLYNGGLRGKRVLLPEEIAEVVCFLLCESSKCITGAIIPCDVGESLR